MMNVKRAALGVALAVALAPCGSAETAPASFYEAFNKGAFFYERGDYDTAIECFTDAIKLNPNDANIYTARGIAYSKKGDYDQAIADYTQAIKLDPNDALAKKGLKWHRDEGDRRNRFGKDDTLFFPTPLSPFAFSGYASTLAHGAQIAVFTA